MSRPAPLLRAYPAWLETFWSEEALSVSGLTSLPHALESLEGAVRALSDLFTTERPSTFRPYGEDPRQGAAYGLFFFPQSYLKGRLVLQEMWDWRGWRPQPASGPLRLLELGAGQGPVGLGIIHRLRELGWQGPIEWTACDHSPRKLHTIPRMLSRAVPALGEVLFRPLAIQISRKRTGLDQAADLVVAGFSLNEIWAPLAQRERVSFLTEMTGAVRPGGLALLLEPALRDTALGLHRTVAQWHDPDRGRHCWGPYLGDHPDPLSQDPQFWTHEVRPWTPPESMAALNRRLWRDIGELRFSYAALGGSPPPASYPNPSMHRLVSPMAAVKGRLLWAGMDGEGRRQSYDLPTRGLDPPVIKQTCSWERGDLLRVEEALPLQGAGNWRVPRLDCLRRHYALPP